MEVLGVFLDRFDAFFAALITAVGAWLVSRQSRKTNLRATLDTSALDTITRLEARVTALEKKVGVGDAYANYAIKEMRRVEEWLEGQDLHWPPPPPLSFYAWLNEQDRMQRK